MVSTTGKVILVDDDEDDDDIQEVDDDQEDSKLFVSSGREAPSSNVDAPANNVDNVSEVSSFDSFPRQHLGMRCRRGAPKPGPGARTG